MVIERRLIYNWDSSAAIDVISWPPSLTAIPDFKNDDILFNYGAMACYKKKGNLALNARRWTVFFQIYIKITVFQWTLFDFDQI